MKTYEAIFAYIDSLNIIDTHEHLPSHESARNQKGDVFTEFLTHYFNRDLFSAGCPVATMQKVLDTSLPIMERWQLIEPYWINARHTGYGRALDITAEGIYGIAGGISGKTIEAIDNALKSHMNDNHYERVLKEKSRILISVLDSDLNCNTRYFRSVFRLEDIVMTRDAAQVNEVAKRTNVPVRSFADWLDACDAAVDQAVEQGAVAHKIGLAYQRSLFFDRASYADAEACFRSFNFNLHQPDWLAHPIDTTKAYQDFMMHRILRRLAQRGTTVQIHTGLQEGNGNVLKNSDPLLLTNLFLEYPDLTFDLMHISYPYFMQLGALSKMFPNVFIDMCWGHIISPNACINAVNEWLDTVPANKICAFGGDYCFIDGVYGHQYLARENIAKSLTKKVDDGIFDVDEACRIAKLMFVDTPYKVFNLENAGIVI